MARRKSPSDTRRKLANMVPFTLVFLVVMAGVMWHQGRRSDTADRTNQALVEAFASMHLPQAIERCHELLRRRHDNPRPVALAWQPGRVDWYELRDFDPRVMRLFSCDGVEVWQGAGVPRVLPDRMPRQPPADDGADPRTELFERLARQPADDLQALEVALDPQPGANPQWVERRWVSGVAQSAHPLADRLARLFAEQPPGLPAAPLLQPLPTNNWLENPKAAFALLAEHVPAHGRVVMVEIEAAKLSVVIAGPLPDDSARKPSLFGEAEFDEFGARRHPYWYPHDRVPKACYHGRPLSEVRDAFWAAWPTKASGHLHRILFGCGERIEPGGEWRFTMRGSRR